MELYISKPYISQGQKTNTTRLNSNLILPGGGEYELYFEVNSKYGEHLVDELSDGIVVCVLLYAMERNMDIRCEGPISERLANQLNNYLIPAIAQNIKRYKSISINAEIQNIHFNGLAVGTGLSCGVDSFYSVFKGLEHEDNSALKLTHCCYFNAGSTGFWGGEDARNLYQKRMKRFEKVSEELGCEFICCDSNMTEFLLQENEMSHVFRTLSIPLVLQKLFGVYYFASSYPFEDFKFSDFDPSYYDILTLPMLSNDNIRFELVGAETTRLGKCSYLSSKDITYNNLHVCITDEYNCGYCRKCLRTMLDFYLIGHLDDYASVFDVEKFKKNKQRIFIWAILNFWRVDMLEIVKGLFKHRQTNILHVICAVIVSPIYYVRIVARKIRFKLSIRNAKTELLVK